MEDEVLSQSEIPGYIMSHLKNADVRSKKDFIKQFVILFLRRNQRLSDAARIFEDVFKIKLQDHIKKILLNEKELFDANKAHNSEAIEQLCVYLATKSPICDDKIINVRLCNIKQIIGQLIN